MQPKTLLALSLLILGLGAFIFLYEKDLPSTDEGVELDKLVLKLEEDDVQSILIEWDEQEVRLERQKSTASPPRGAQAASPRRGAQAVEEGEDQDVSDSPSGWRLTAPMAAQADRFAVERLVGSLTGLESSRALEDFDRADLGLDDPRARVTLQSQDSQIVLEIGTEVPASSDMVVAVVGRAEAHLVGSSLFTDLTKAPGDWRDKQLFREARAAVDRVTLEGSSGKVLLARRGDDFWIESPFADRADEQRVNTLMSGLTSLRVSTFLDNTPLTSEGMGLDPAQGVVEVVLAGQEQPFRLELGDAKEDDSGVSYGRVGTQVFELETRLTESLAVDASDWRSKSWTDLQVFEIESARFEDADGVLEISREGSDWKRGEDSIAYSKVSDLLYPISEVKGEQVVERDLAESRGYDLQSPELSVFLTTKDGEHRLALSPVIDGLAAATAEGRDAVVLVAEAEMDEIREQLRLLRKAEPLPEEDDEKDEKDEKEEEGAE